MPVLPCRQGSSFAMVVFPRQCGTGKTSYLRREYENRGIPFSHTCLLCMMEAIFSLPMVSRSF